MRKLLLAIFLLSISNNALAKVEIWECKATKYYDVSKERIEKFSKRIFKLETGSPVKVYERALGKWELWIPSEDWYYDKENQSIIITFKENTESDGGRVFDLILKELKWFNDSKNRDSVDAIYKCKVIE
jgi:hypothetical protein